jgi:polyribonucleotide nucleotidyltransferase
MLELGPRELLTLGTVLAGLAATWGVLKATIKSIVGQVDDIKSDVTKIYQQVDNQEATQAVLQNSIKIISQDILSPQILKTQSERDGRNEERIRMLEERMNRIVSMHNGKHPPTAKEVS